MDFSRLLSFKFVVPTPRRSAEAGSGFAPFKPGLSFKLLLIVVGVSLIGVLASSSLVLTLQRQQLIDSAQTATMRLSDAIKASLEHAMLNNDRAMVNQIVQTEVGEKGVERIRILDTRGW